MINLLPHEQKRQLRAARVNTLLLRYNILILIAVGFLATAEGFTYFYLVNTKTAAEATITENRAKAVNYVPIEAQAQLFRNNLATAKQILDREVTYTKVILEISKLLPSGVVLDTLNLDSQTFGTQTTLTAQAKDYNRALALKDSFENSTLFSNVHFQSIATTDTPKNPAYPVDVNINVTIKKDAAK